MTVTSGGCELTYADGELTVTYNGREISFVPTSGEGGVTVYRGRRAGTVPERGIFTDDTDDDELLSGNDFEIAFSRGGEYRIRRL